MKSQVSFLLQRLHKEEKKLTSQDISDIAYEFQEATCEILAKRLIKAGKAYGAKTLAVAGGVSANARLFERLSTRETGEKERNSDAPEIIFPTKKVFSTDNGAMIGLVGILHQLRFF